MPPTPLSVVRLFARANPVMGAAVLAAVGHEPKGGPEAGGGGQFHARFEIAIALREFPVGVEESCGIRGLPRLFVRRIVIMKAGLFFIVQDDFPVFQDDVVLAEVRPLIPVIVTVNVPFGVIDRGGR